MRGQSLVTLVILLGVLCAFDMIAFGGRYSKQAVLESMALMDGGYQQGHQAFGGIGDWVNGQFRR